jgi:hypothetical protein
MDETFGVCFSGMSKPYNRVLAENGGKDAVRSAMPLGYLGSTGIG